MVFPFYLLKGGTFEKLEIHLFKWHHFPSQPQDLSADSHFILMTKEMIIKTNYTELKDKYSILLFC